MAENKTGKPESPAGVRRVEEALEHIETGIRDGIYLPGHRLVEAELAKNSSLGIGPIREALRILAGEGLIEIRPYRGATVTRLSVDEIEKVYQAAKGVVYMSLMLVVEACRDKNNRPPIEAALDDIKQSVDGPLTDFLSALSAYYFIIHEVIENPYLTSLIKRLHLGLVHREIANLHPNFDRQSIVKAYSDATDAIFKGDFEKAKELQFAHFDSYIEVVRLASPTHAATKQAIGS